MIDPDIHLTSTRWREEISDEGGRIFTRGTIWSDNGPATAAFGKSSVEAFAGYLNTCSGFYALIYRNDDHLMAAVDHIRSIPLFYSLSNGKLYLSDSAEWIRRETANTQMDPLAKAEFQLISCVSGGDTLFPDIKQLQAGECLMAQMIDGQMSLTLHRYYHFARKEPDSYDESTLWKALDAAAVSAVQRLIDYADGRQIVVPLSGGYDSRMIVTLLKRLGCENVLTFTYGTRKSREVEYSRRVAEALGLKWVFVEYTNELWRNVWQTEDRRRYQIMASGWSSLPHMQDWLAVKVLKEKSMVEADSVFVPGHAGGFVVGGLVPEETFSIRQYSLKKVSAALLKKYYSEAPLEVFGIPVGVWQQRIELLLGNVTVNTQREFVNAYERWGWQERQAKFIVNSVRVYEFFDYDWWMPIWYNEFVQFWENIPISFRRNRAWHIDYVNQQYSIHAIAEENPVSGNATNDNPLRLKVGDLAKRALPRYLRNYLLRKKRLRDLRQHPNAVFGRFDEGVCAAYSNRGYLLNGISAAVFLDSVEEMIRDQA